MTTLLEPPTIFAGGRPPLPFDPLQGPAEETAPPEAETEEEEEI